MTRRTKWFGWLAALGLVAGVLTWRHETYRRIAHRRVGAVLSRIQQGHLQEIGSDELGANAKTNLEQFERAKGGIERFELDALNGIPGIGPAQLSGFVTRRRQTFGFGMLLWTDGRPVSYHEWPLSED